MHTIEEIEKRRTEILTEMEAEGADLPALLKEMRQLHAEEMELRAQASAAEETRRRVAGGSGTRVRSFSDLGNLRAPAQGQTEQRQAMTVDSAEYRRAYICDLMGRDMDAETRAAFTATTANTGVVVPTTLLDEIWDLVSGQHVIMGDINVLRTGTTLEILKHTAITAGAAKQVAENAANDDEQNTFVKVTLAGKDFSKTIKISYALQTMAVPAFEKYLTQEIANGISEAMAAHTVSAIETGMAAGNKVAVTAAKGLTYADLTKAFGQLKRASKVVVYATRSTIYNRLVSMVDTTGRPIFQPSLQAGAEGVLLGAQIKIEDAVADDKLLIGDPTKVTCNMVQDIMIETDRDISNHVNIMSGYARGESALIDDVAFAEITIS